MTDIRRTRFQGILGFASLVGVFASCTSAPVDSGRVPASNLPSEIKPGIYQGADATALQNPMTGGGCGIEVVRAENGDITIPKTVSWGLYTGAWGNNPLVFGPKKEPLIQYKDFITSEFKESHADLIEHLNTLNWNGYISWYDEKYDFVAIVGQKGDGTPDFLWLDSSLRRPDHKSAVTPTFKSVSKGKSGHFSCYGLKAAKEIKLGGHWRRDYFGWPKMGCTDLYADRVKGLMVPYGTKKGETLGIFGMTFLSCIAPPVCIMAYIGEAIGFSYAQIQSKKYLYPAGVLGDLLQGEVQAAIETKQKERKNYYFDHLLKEMNKKLKRSGKTVTADELVTLVKKLNQEEAFCPGEAELKRDEFKKVVLDALQGK